jgi:hypothetical protein
MRLINGLLCLVMVLFAAVQYNDPDLWFWVPVYLVPALWTGLGAFRPGRLVAPLPSLGIGLSLAFAAVLTAVYWPTDVGWWRQEVWVHSETAREGMGLMIVTATLLVVVATLLLTRSRARAAA